MRKLILSLMVFLAAGGMTAASATSIYDFTMKSIDGQPVSLKSYSGKVVLLVNVASKCGFTPQYAGLEARLREVQGPRPGHRRCPGQQLRAAGAGNQRRDQDVLLPQIQRDLPDDVEGLGARATTRRRSTSSSPTSRANPKIGGDIKWNFTKFLFDRNGKPVARFEPAVTPDSPEVQAAIESALGK